MNITIKSKTGLRYVYNRKTLPIISLLFIITLTSSCLISEFKDVAPFALGTSGKVVGNEIELTNAIDNAPSGVSVVIALDKDVTLTWTLVIPAGKNITLTSSNSNGKFFKLIGADGASTIVVMDNGMVKLDGILVTHESGTRGRGVSVNPYGTLILSDGTISGNMEPWGGGGVYNRGTFSMVGGEISNNIVSFDGGGVHNEGNFTMINGKISGNTAFEPNEWSRQGDGGGICNSGNFFMLGGQVSGNTAKYSGGGVLTFGSFTMSGGEISDNTAGDKGGGVYNSGVFMMTDGKISNNLADIGGGVCIDRKFTMLGGVISGNSAAYNGGGVYIGSRDVTGIFELIGGKISDNTACTGGGIWVDVKELDKLFVSNGAVFSNNHALTAYNRDNVHDNVYNSNIGSKVTWTAPFTQGYNNYDISYTSGSQIANPKPSNTPLNTEPSGQWSMADYFVLIGFSVALLVGIVAGVLFVYFKKRMVLVEAKFNALSQGKVEA